MVCRLLLLNWTSKRSFFLRQMWSFFSHFILQTLYIPCIVFTNDGFILLKVITNVMMNSGFAIVINLLEKSPEFLWRSIQFSGSISDRALTNAESFFRSKCSKFWAYVQVMLQLSRLYNNLRTSTTHSTGNPEFDVSLVLVRPF